MKPSSLTVFLVIFAFGFLTPWVVEGGFRGELDSLRPYAEDCKPGLCPFQRLAKCMSYEPPECRDDWQCPRKQKCCYDRCSRKCMDPVFDQESVKFTPGKCPVVTGHHCPKGLQCCRGVCGNSCVQPVKDKEKTWQDPYPPVS
uniref:WAP domain-containing protein n=1 Tax=Monodon monoceros TaxID=40151 RepID=A0A8C6ADX2_MONMO